MAEFPVTLGFLADSTLGIFGAGNLGRTVASCLIRSGFPSARIAVSRGRTEETRRRLEAEGLGPNLVESSELAACARIVLVLVRPQNVGSLASLRLRDDALVVSFLAGVPLAALPLRTPFRVRVMPSSPETWTARKAVAGVFPAGNAVAEELLDGMGVRRLTLEKEDDVHAFTALGPCLPIALSLWMSRGGDVDDERILDCAGRFGLEGYGRILEWARRAVPVFESEAAGRAYFSRAATPGGVTEAILRVIESGGDLVEALERGVRRSRELSALAGVRP